MTNGSGLPNGWGWVTVDEVATTATGGTPDRKNTDYFGGDIPWVKSGELGDGYVFEAEETLSKLGVEESSAKVFPKGTLCIALYGATVGKLGILGIDAATNQAVCGIFLPADVLVRYLFHYLTHLRPWLIKQGKGGAQSNISNGLVRGTKVPLPPLPEQHRIVDKIEELFSDLDAGVQNLERAKANLKRYRASVLKAAVEGRLTEEWRAEHPQEEDGQMLLDRILRERREKWEQDELAKYAEKGKQPPKNWQSKYKEPAEPDVSELPELPAGWGWATVESTVQSVATGATPLRSNPAFWQGGTVPWVTSSCVNVDTVTASDEFITETALRTTNAKVFPSGTLLVALYGEGKTRGRITELRINAATNQACAALLFGTEDRGLRPFVKLFFQHNYTQIRRLSAGGVQPNLSLSLIREQPIPLPSLAEQQEIVALVEERLSQIDAAEKTIDAELLRAKRLRQSILKQAFEGNLVPQDPNDEPASVLLERIKAARAAEQPKKRTKRSKKATAK